MMGRVALMTATFAVLVSCRAERKHTMPSVQRGATSQPRKNVALKA
jgi:hypothetical protein